MMDNIDVELGFIYIYKGKKFLTKGEAVRYIELLKHMKNEKELIKEWNKEKESKLVEKAWKEE